LFSLLLAANTYKGIDKISTPKNIVNKWVNQIKYEHHIN
jgi:hypothetical protein